LAGVGGCAFGGTIVLSMIALFGAAAFCFEQLATRDSKKKKAK